MLNQEICVEWWTHCISWSLQIMCSALFWREACLTSSLKHSKRTRTTLYKYLINILLLFVYLSILMVFDCGVVAYCIGQLVWTSEIAPCSQKDREGFTLCCYPPRAPQELCCWHQWAQCSCFTYLLTITLLFCYFVFWVLLFDNEKETATTYMHVFARAYSAKLGTDNSLPISNVAFAPK